MIELPKGWVSACLPDLIGKAGVFADGDWVESKDQNPDGDVRLIQLADVGDGRYRDRSARSLTLSKARELGCTFLESGDVLIARMPDPLGRACIFPGDKRISVTVVDVCIVRPATSGVDPRWLMHTLNAPQSRAAMVAFEKGTTRKRISRTNLARIELPLPPVPEQERIVAVIEEQFSRIDAGVAALARVRHDLSRMRAAVLHSAVTGRLTNPHLRELDPAGRPADWSQVFLGDIAEVSGGITKNPKRKPHNNPVPFLRVANVLRDGLRLDDVHEIEVFAGELERLRLRAGDLLVVEGNGSPTQIGRCALWHGEIDPCVHQNHLIRVRPSDRVLPEYLNLYWNAPTSMAMIQAAASSTSGLHTLSTGKVRSIPVALPLPDTQRRIVEEVRRQLFFVDALASELNAATSRSRSLRSSILSEACAGKLAPQDPTDEPASVLLERMANRRIAMTGSRPSTRTHRTGVPA